MKLTLQITPNYYKQIKTFHLQSESFIDRKLVEKQDSKNNLTPHFLKYLKNQIVEKRIELKGYARLDQKKLTWVKLNEKHDVYMNHPESQFSALSKKPNKLSGKRFNDWYKKFHSVLEEKPSLDASTIAIANIENLITKNYQALYEQSKEALKRNPANQDARIENFISRFYLNYNLEKHASELYQLRLELINTTPIKKPTYSIVFGMLYSYFHGLTKSAIHDCVMTSTYNSLLEEFSVKLIDYYNEKEDFAQFHADLLSTPDHLYLFWVCEYLFRNAQILYLNDNHQLFPQITKFFEQKTKLTDFNSMQNLAYEICSVQKSNNLKTDWILCKNFSRALLYFALFEIEDLYSRSFSHNINC